MTKLKTRPALDVTTGVLRQDLMSISLENISFGYIPGRLLFSEIKPLKVRQGDVVAVVGTHGSGKSTFLRLLADRLNPDSGYLFMPSHLRSVFVSGQPIMLNASVWKNLTYGDPDMQDAGMVKGILRELKMHSVLEILELDLTMPTSAIVDGAPALQDKENSRTLMLSGYSPLLGQGDQGEDEEAQGQQHIKIEAQEVSSQQWLNTITYSEKVMISLARALIMNPEVLILYRPFHHFDQSTAENLMQVLLHHHSNRGLCLPEELADVRRPRTVFFTPETSLQARKAHAIWQIDHINKTVYKVHPDGLNESFMPPASAEELAEREKAALEERLRPSWPVPVRDSAKEHAAPKSLVPNIQVNVNSSAASGSKGIQQPSSKSLLAPSKPMLRSAKSSDSVGGVSALSVGGLSTLSTISLATVMSKRDD